MVMYNYYCTKICIDEFDVFITCLIELTNILDG